MNDSAITANYTLLYFIVPEGTSPDFIDLVSSFLFLAFFNKDKSGQRKNILTKADGNKRLFEMIQTQVGEARNVLFWSNNQNVLLSNDIPRLELSSKYGTGNVTRNTYAPLSFLFKSHLPFKLVRKDRGFDREG